MERGVTQFLRHFCQGEAIQGHQFLGFFDFTAADIGLQGGVGFLPEQVGDVIGTVAQAVGDAGDSQGLLNIPVNVPHNPVDQLPRILDAGFIRQSAGRNAESPEGPNDDLCQTGFHDQSAAVGIVAEFIHAPAEMGVDLPPVLADDLAGGLEKPTDLTAEFLIIRRKCEAHIGVEKSILISGLNGVNTGNGSDDDIAGRNSNGFLIQAEAAFAGNDVADFNAGLVVPGHFKARFQAKLADLIEFQTVKFQRLGKKRMVVMKPCAKSLLHKGPPENDVLIVV